MTNTVCPICETEAAGGQHVGDTTVIDCPQCSGYRLTDSALTELQNGTLSMPTPSQFAGLVSRLRNESESPEDYPLITTYNLRDL